MREQLLRTGKWSDSKEGKNCSKSCGVILASVNHEHVCLNKFNLLSRESRTASAAFCSQGMWGLGST